MLAALGQQGVHIQCVGPGRRGGDDLDGLAQRGVVGSGGEASRMHLVGACEAPSVRALATIDGETLPTLESIPWYATARKRTTSA